jgi:CheY-like chemotaxis protein
VKHVPATVRVARRVVSAQPVPPPHIVLVIDDEDPIRDAVRTILEEEGYMVLEAPNGGIGLDLLRASEGSLVVVLDLMMPGMSGIELLHVVVSEPALANRDAYIIFSAAHAFTAPPPSATSWRARRCSSWPSRSTSMTWSLSWRRPRAS